MYSVWAYYKGYDLKFDSRLEKSLGKQSTGSGYGNRDDGSNSRDISWDFNKEEDAENAVKRLKRFRRVCEICVWKDSFDRPLVWKRKYN